MLTPEQAAEKLKQFTIADWGARKVKAMEMLPKPVVQAARGLIEGERRSPAFRRSSESYENILTERLTAIKPKERLAFFTSIFPRLGHVLDRAWCDLGKAPYQTGYQRMPFRAPNEPQLAHQRRVNWVEGIIRTLGRYDPDAEWVATWAGRLGDWYYTEALGPVLAAAIDLGGREGDAVLEILRQSASGTHEIGCMGRHVSRALLSCARPEAWEFMEKMLLSAQREEGLRQSILETVDEGHPDAFVRFLRLIVDENLIRFSSTVRAVDVWFGTLYDALSSKQAEAIVRTALGFLEDPRSRQVALIDGDGQSVYLALWAEAFLDVQSAVQLAERTLTSASEERRFAACKLLSCVDLTSAHASLSRALEDPDLRVAAQAIDGLGGITGFNDHPQIVNELPKTFDRLLRLMGRIDGKSVKMKPLVFPWERDKLESSEVGAVLMNYVPEGQALRVLSVLDRFGPDDRGRFACMLAGVESTYALRYEKKKVKKIERETRPAIIALLGDPASSVREVARAIMNQFRLESDEANKHEELLERNASDVRSGALDRLRSLDDAALLKTCGRLLTGGAPARAGALELLRIMSEGKRSVDAARALARAYRDKETKRSKDEERQLGLILDVKSDDPSRQWTLANAFGLLDNDKRGRVEPPRELSEFVFDDSAGRVLSDLDAIVEANKLRELPCRYSEPDNPPLLGGDRFWLVARPRDKKTRAERIESCPVRDLIDGWWNAQKAPPAERERALLGAMVALHLIDKRRANNDFKSTKLPSVYNKMRFVAGAEYLFSWLWAIYGPQDAVGQVLDWCETSVARAKLDPATIDPRKSEGDSLRSIVKGAFKTIMNLALPAGEIGGEKLEPSVENWIEIARSELQAQGLSASLEHHARLWRLTRWLELYSTVVHEAQVKLVEAEAKGSLGWEQRERLRRRLSMRPTLSETLNAWAAGAASEHDFFAAALRAGESDYMGFGFRDLSRLGRSGSRPDVHWPAGADEAYEKLRSRIIEVELARGDAPTEASGPALALRPSGGMDVVVQVLARIGRERLLRGFQRAQTSRAAVYSSLLRNAVPREGETPERFAQVAQAEKLAEDRLIELALYAPHWAQHVESALGWRGLAEGVWWIHAHTKDPKWSIDSEIREGWDARIAERTPVTKDELEAGAVDPEWFARVQEELGRERWERIYDAAKYASGAGGHKRAQLFADTMLGVTSEQELIERINTKRHQDSVRALGLCPVRSGKAGTAQVLARYKLMQEFRRTSSKHGGSMLQASEKRAVEIAMENLARTAGYADPIRLQWAMETEAIADLSKGPIVVSVGETSVSLAVDVEGVPSLSAVKKGKALKSVPADAKKDERVKALSERLSDLRRQGSRMRLSLELAMCRGDEFSGDEVAGLWRHPILRPMLGRIIFASAGELGYLSDEGKALKGLSGRTHAIERDARVRIAHPHDLLASKRWHDWQSECMNAQRVQPFKQIFRELYVPTASERGDAKETTRYRGHQVQPRQALALFGTRGWVARPEEGIHRTFHHERLTAFVTFEEYFHTPAEIECLTLRGLSFVPVGKYEPVPLDQVPARLFSEVLRDMDLVVSVAHAGGVDPEASQSSIEMRGALLRETARVLGLTNVSVEKQWASIKGKLGEYALHLGSASVQKLPGGSVFIVAVQSQHRGRVFLPFADDDPKTAEVMAKAIMLARDNEIRDPSILEQLHR